MCAITASIKLETPISNEVYHILTKCLGNNNYSKPFIAGQDISYPGLFFSFNCNRYTLCLV